MSTVLSKMMKRLRSLRRDGKEFTRARSGVVAVIFALALLPIMFMLGAVVDYSRATSMKSRLQNAVDLAALRVGSQPGLTAAQHQQIASQMVAADIGAALVTSLNVNVTETDLPNGAGWQVNASASMPDMILPVMSVKSSTFSASAQASSQLTTTNGNPVTNINLHILVDNSASMGVGANASDQSGMSSGSLKCSYACHSSVAAYTTTTDACRGPEKTATITDGVTYAHEQGYSLRIDAVKTALTNFINQCQTNAAATGATINVALYTFAGGLTTVHALDNNYSAAATAVNGIDIASESSGTSFESALSTIQTTIGTTAGDGTSASKPLTYVVLVSDGLYDDANPLQSTYVPPPAPVCTTTCTCQDNWGNSCNQGYQGNQCNQDNQCWYNHDQRDHNDCHPVTTQTCTTTTSGSTIAVGNSPSDASYNGNVGNTANTNNVFNYSLDGNSNLLTGDQNNADHWSVGQAQTGVLCYPNSTTTSSPIGATPYVLPTGTASAPPCIPDPVNGGNFELGPINPSVCTPLTQAGVKVVTLYTTYMLDNPTPTAPTDSQYYDWRVYYMQNYVDSTGTTFLKSLQNNMAACASSASYAYTATSSTDISTAMTSITNTTTAAPLHLVK
jgi:Flp pilus assembly protein TadG